MHNMSCESASGDRVTQEEFAFYNAASQRTCVLKNTLLLGEMMPLVRHWERMNWGIGYGVYWGTSLESTAADQSRSDVI